ncbi:MAG: hypothetical protein ACOCRO_00700, partial [Halanaerobiales bacterium]
MLTINDITKKLNISNITAQLILNRGIETEEDLERYLYGTINDLYDPALIPGIDDVVDKIKEHVNKGSHITVFGDFDVDVTTGSYMMYEAIRRYAKANNKECILDIFPGNRYIDGYGMSYKAVD